MQLLGKKDLELLDLFNRYLDWIQDNNLKDTLDNYTIYVTNIEKFNFNKDNSDWSKFGQK